MAAPFWYELPAGQIAQRPAEPPDAARLLVCSGSKLTDCRFSNLPDFLREGDLLVFNNTKVLPARLFGQVPSGAAVELLLLRKEGALRWRAMGRPLKRLLREGTVEFSDGVVFQIEEQISSREVMGEFGGVSEEKFTVWLHENGIMPIPPYIREGRGDAQDRDDYQTLFALEEGSVAAPTASLHFTNELLARVRSGWKCVEVTLHVGPASFLSIWEKTAAGAELLPPGPERLFFQRSLMEELKAHRSEGKRIIAVGTTVVRYLESLPSFSPEVEDGWYETDLMILPQYNFQFVDGLITNFHQPGSSHLSLVEAFAGRELLSRSYQHALEQGYQFLSYGDAQLYLRDEEQHRL